MSIRIKTVLSIALLLSICIPQVSFGQENMSFEITSYGNLDGYDGYFQEMRFDGELHETDFLFEENGYIRWYAFKMSWQDEFQNLPEGTYVVKNENLWIGDQWNSWWGGETTTATVIDTVTIILAERDTIFTFIVINQDQYGDIISMSWFGEILSRVWMVYDENLAILSSWSILGGYGYYPLFVGNRWEYRSMYENNVLDISIDSTTYIFGDTHHVANMSWDSYYSETNYFKTINDTLYCKGVAFPGEPPQQANYIMTPQYPTLGSEWYSFWIESTVLFYVSDFTSVTVPAGTFDAYEYTITDSLTGEYIGTWYTSNGTGPVKWGMVQEDDSISYELNGYGLAGGYGAWPIEVGNQWTFYKEGYTDIDDFNEIIIPSCITLNQNYPNPFNANTTIQYILPYQSEVHLEIFNILGRRVEKLLDSKQQSGQYSIMWNASDYSSGIYFYRLTSGDKSFTKRMTLLK